MRAISVTAGCKRQGEIKKKILWRPLTKAAERERREDVMVILALASCTLFKLIVYVQLDQKLLHLCLECSVFWCGLF